MIEDSLAIPESKVRMNYALVIQVLHATGYLVGKVHLMSNSHRLHTHTNKKNMQN